MKVRRIPGWILAVALATALPVTAQQTTPETQGKEVRPVQEPEEPEITGEQLPAEEVVPLPVYIPPPRGTPSTRVGAATRGCWVSREEAGCRPVAGHPAPAWAPRHAASGRISRDWKSWHRTTWASRSRRNRR